MPATTRHFFQSSHFAANAATNSHKAFYDEAADDKQFAADKEIGKRRADGGDDHAPRRAEQQHRRKDADIAQRCVNARADLLFAQRVGKRHVHTDQRGNQNRSGKAGKDGDQLPFVNVFPVHLCASR